MDHLHKTVYITFLSWLHIVAMNTEQGNSSTWNCVGFNEFTRGPVILDGNQDLNHCENGLETVL